MINKNISELVLNNLFEYDFTACTYNILKSIGWDLSNIELDNKKLRNIQIGLLQRDNPSLSKFIIDSTNNLIDFYIKENRLSNNDIIVRQRDGIITRKRMNIINTSMPIELRNTISKIIITMQRGEWLILYMDGNYAVKGIKDRPVDMSFMEMFKNINFLSKKSVILSLDNMRKRILTGGNIWWYVKKDNDEYIVPFTREGVMRFPKSVISSIDVKDIEKSFVWEDYVWPFAQSLIIECMERNLC